MKISASFLSIKEDLKENISKLTQSNIDYLHLDIMDGKFVLNKTFGYEEIIKLINNDKPLDIHLMVDDVYKYIGEFKKLKPEFITFHYETKENIMELIVYLKENNIKAGLSIKPETKVECLIPYLPFVDLVLLMSVEPGMGGQIFIQSTEDKLNKLIELRSDNSYDFLIEVDGGINNETIRKVNKSDIVVVGNYITSGNYNERIKEIKGVIHE